MARYLKLFEVTKSVWFHLHWICLIVAYGIGTYGYLLVIFHDGIVQFLLDDPFAVLLCAACTFQMLHYIFVWPNDEDQRRKLKWKFFHLIGGFLAVQIAMLNGGYSIPKRIYIGILLSLGCVAAILEYVQYRFRLKDLNILKNLAQVHPLE